MKRLVHVLVCLAAVVGNTSFSHAEIVGVLNRDGSMALVPTGGGAPASIPNSFQGLGLSMDHSGNYIIATGSFLERVTPGGVSTLIATISTGQLVAVDMDASGNYIVADNVQDRVLRINPAGTTITTVAAFPVSSPSEGQDDWVRVDKNGNYIVTDDSGLVGRIYVMTPGGSVTNLTLNGPAIPRIGGLTINDAGNYVVTDYINNVIDVITPGGVVSTLLSGHPFNELTGIAWDPSLQKYFFVDRGTNTLYSLSANGQTLATVYSGSALSSPTGVAVPTPEPAALGLLAVGSVALLLKRRVRRL